MIQSSTKYSMNQDNIRRAIEIVKTRIPQIKSYTSLKKVSNTESQGPCPFCGGNNRFRYHTGGDLQGKGICRHCGFSGDILDVYMKLNGINSLPEIIKQFTPELLEQKQTANNDFAAPTTKKNVARQETEESSINDPAIKKNRYIYERHCSTQLCHDRILKLFSEHRGIPEDYIRPKVEAGLFKWKRNHGDQSKPDECIDVVVVPFHSLPGKEHVAQQYFTPDNTCFPCTTSKKKSSAAIGKGFYFDGAPINAPGTRALFITESVINALTLLPYVDTETTCIIAIASSSEATRKAERLKPWIQNIDKVISCGDNDVAGNNMDNKIAAVLRNTVSVQALGWREDDPSDINDLQREGRWDRISELISNPIGITIRDDSTGTEKQRNINTELIPIDPDLPIEQRIEQAQKRLKDNTDESKLEMILFELKRLQFEYAASVFPRCDFPWETVSDRLSQSLKQLARSCATNAIHLTGICLAIMGASVGRHIEVRIKDSWSEPLIFWIISLLDSGDGKTPALNLLCKILEDHQRILDQIYRAEMEEYENAEKDNKPREPRKPGGVYTTDYTIEGLFRDQRPNGGTLVVNDEATGFFDNQNQYKSGKGTDRQQMLKLYDGSRARKVRVKDVITLEGSRISIAGGTQPEVFKTVFQGDGEIFRVDGSLFRFMMTYDRGFYPSTVESWDDQNRGYWEQTINNAFTFCESQTGMGDDEEIIINTLPLWFTEESLEYFIDWQNNYKAVKRFFPDALKGYLPKMFGWVARISGALKCFDEFQHGSRINNPQIDLDLLKKAIKVSEFYMGQNTEIMREVTLETPGTRTFTEQEKHLCNTLLALQHEVDNGRLAVAFILEKYNHGAGAGIGLKNSQALTALIRSAGLTIPAKKASANGFKNYTCLTWDKKVEILLDKFSTFSTNSTSLQPQGFEAVENLKQFSTNSTRLTAKSIDQSIQVEKVENRKPKSTSVEPGNTGLVENVENCFKENPEIDDVVTI